MSDTPKIQEHPAVIVLVEDETLVRANALEAFRDAGFEVVEAAHSDEAVAAIEADATAVHALFTDVQMPGGSMDGLALAHHARAAWPWIGVVIASGNPGQHAVLPEGCRFFAKPYELREVVKHLRELTSPARQGGL